MSIASSMFFCHMIRPAYSSTGSRSITTGPCHQLSETPGVSTSSGPDGRSRAAWMRATVSVLLASTCA